MSNLKKFTSLMCFKILVLTTIPYFCSFRTFDIELLRSNQRMFCCSLDKWREWYKLESVEIFLAHALYLRHFLDFVSRVDSESSWISLHEYIFCWVPGFGPTNPDSSLKVACPRLPDRWSSLNFCESSVTKRIVIPSRKIFYAISFIRCFSLFIKNGRLPRWGRMLLNWGIGRASLSEYWVGYRTANKQERSHVWDLCVKKRRWQKRS